MSDYQLVLLAVLLVLIAVAVYLNLPPRRSGRDGSMTADAYHSDSAQRDDERNWLGGFIYNNPDDPNLFVPRRYGLGWTINFGHPQGKALLIGLLLVVLLLVVLGPLARGASGSIGYHPLGRLLP